ncbi:MAG: hypothetical protein K6E19_05605 [Lachnospiraceae bacterium]|nr:hypothetical protein [Lachnospiraceae bacterium]
MEPTPQGNLQRQRNTQPLYVEGAGLLSQDYQTTQATPINYQQIKQDTRVKKSSSSAKTREHILFVKNDIQMAASVLTSDTVPAEYRKKYNKVFESISQYCSITDTWADAEADRNFWTEVKHFFSHYSTRKKLKNETKYMNESIKGLKEIISDPATSEEMRIVLTQCLNKLIVAGGGLADDTRTGHELTADVLQKKGWEAGRVLDVTGKTIASSDRSETKSSISAKLDKRGEPLFSHEPCVEDVQQGCMGDCYFISSIAETVAKNPKMIKDSMLDNNDGTVTVRMYDKDQTGQFHPVYVTVSKEVRATGAGGATWVAIMEKAFAAHRQDKAKNGLEVKTGEKDGNDEYEYQAVRADTIDYGYISQGGFSNEATEEFLGKKAEKTIYIREGYDDKTNTIAMIDAALRVDNAYLRAVKELDVAIAHEKQRLKDLFDPKNEKSVVKDPQYQNWVYEMKVIQEEFNTINNGDSAAFYKRKGIPDDPQKQLLYAQKAAERMAEIDRKMKAFEATFNDTLNRLEQRKNELMTAAKLEGESYLFDGKIILKSSELDEEARAKCTENTSAEDIAKVQTLVRQTFADYLSYDKNIFKFDGSREDLKDALEKRINTGRRNLLELAGELGYNSETKSAGEYTFMEKVLHSNMYNSIKDRIDTDELVKLCMKDMLINMEKAYANLGKIHVKEKQLLSGEYSQYTSELFETIKAGLQSGKLLNCGSRKIDSKERGTSGEGLRDGISGGHAYSILDTMEKGGRKYVKLRNPWGSYSMKYVETEKDGKKQIVAKKYKNAKDGVFWVDMNHFVQLFDQLFQNAS